MNQNCGNCGWSKAKRDGLKCRKYELYVRAHYGRRCLDFKIAKGKKP